MGPESFENHFAGRGRRAHVFLIGNAETVDMVEQILDVRELLVALVDRGEIRELEFAAKFKPLNDGLKIHVSKMLAENAANGGANQLARDCVRAFQFAFVFEFELAGDGGQRRVDIGNTGDGAFFSRAGGALFSAAHDAFENGDGKALADAGALVHALVFARLEGDFFDKLAEIARNVDFASGIARSPSLLGGDGHAFFDAGGVVGANFGADAILERRSEEHTSEL